MKNDLPVLARKLSIVYQRRLRIRGPYLCKDGRKRVDVVSYNSNKDPVTCLLARVRLEIKIGRKLRLGETVDHINEDKTDDSYANLQLLSLAANSKKSAKRALKTVGSCIQCGTRFNLSRHQLDARSKSKAGPFCSRSCSGAYGAQVQNTGTRRKRVTYKRKYNK